MDKRSHQSIATKIGLGVPSARRFVGMYYVTNNGKAHVSQMDSCIQVEDIDRVAVVEEDGKMFAVESSPFRHDQTNIEICDKCAKLDDLDYSWYDGAACRDARSDDFFERAGARLAIEQYCDHCPVVRECLETGALLDKQNAGTVWGGVYFSTERRDRLEAIDAKRKALARGA